MCSTRLRPRPGQIAGGQAPDLVVKLTIDPTLQTTGRQALVRADDGARARRRGGVRQGALVAAGAGRGHPRHGRRPRSSASAFNRATQAQRQPGSSFKAFVYAAAMETGRGADRHPPTTRR